jgi:hypothetical protein
MKYDEIKWDLIYGYTMVTMGSHLMGFHQQWG